MKKYKVNFKIIKEHPDGSADAEFQYDNEFADHIKKKFGIKRLSKKRMKQIILDLLTEGVETFSE